MADSNRNTFNRPDTFFGVCEAIGQDFGFNPLWVRLAFVPPVFFQPAYALVAYIALGLVVLASRLMFPAQVAADNVVADVAATAPKLVPMAREEARVEPLALAA
jgi:phage shock protein PspC (stress-responsive transcriptional regulator)